MPPHRIMSEDLMESSLRVHEASLPPNDGIQGTPPAQPRRAYSLNSVERLSENPR
jgi:hypothetical protein